MHGQGKAAAWYGRLLLFAALVLGIVTMHTLGHPAEHSGPAPSAVTSQEASDASAAPGVAHRPVPAAGTPGVAHHPAPDAAGAPARVGGPAAVPAHGDGMDPMSVCLAVLGAGWTVALLIALAALRRPAGGAPAAVRAWFSRALWPDPPPRHKALARLSVLRV
ncbi:hypothetical protein [Streptomyces sp. NPDC053048]|uniref:hypothetical protein n=1 Tax=Streptomyces sp. NPDC053048 TaxID=3365694 RepID=UPI0037D133AA